MLRKFCRQSYALTQSFLAARIVTPGDPRYAYSYEGVLRDTFLPPNSVAEKLDQLTRLVVALDANVARVGYTYDRFDAGVSLIDAALVRTAGLEDMRGEELRMVEDRHVNYDLAEYSTEDAASLTHRLEIFDYPLREVVAEPGPENAASVEGSSRTV